MRHIGEEIEEYLGGNLRPEDRAQLERHAAQCSSCRKKLESALETRECLGWLAPVEPPPQPGPDFYYRVQESIERELGGSWLGSVAATMRLRLAYPLVILCLLVLAWSLTRDVNVDTYSNFDGFAATEYPAMASSESSATDFAQMSFRNAGQGRDIVMMTLVGSPD